MLACTVGAEVRGGVQLRVSRFIGIAGVHPRQSGGRESDRTAASGVGFTSFTGFRYRAPRMKLFRSGRAIPTMFDLLGDWEDDMTYSLGLVASRCIHFASALATAVGGTPGADDVGTVQLQTVDLDGRSDLELQWAGLFHGVFEAKRGPQLPSLQQLQKYVPRLVASLAHTKVLVAVTNATPEYACLALPPDLNGIPLRHLAWRTIRDLARSARPKEPVRNRGMLAEFESYLTEILGMEKTQSNMVYVVSLGDGGTWGLDFKDVALRRRRYFYPLEGGGWPSPPPNYLAFRFDGRLQSIHHVDRHQIFDNARQAIPDATEESIPPHYLLELGPPIQPAREVRNGDKIRMNIRVWAMIDLLLTCSTITEARDETKRRLGSDAKELVEQEVE
jgi:hypothetical protein